jgi:hypothetical protein
MKKPWLVGSLAATLIAVSVPTAAQTKEKPKAAKSEAKAKAKAAAPKKQPVLRKPARTEKLACKTGTEDRHARIALEYGAGKVWTFAYYSIWKPRTCSIYLERDTKWKDTGNLTEILLDTGHFQIDHAKNEFTFTFKDVDRERYCQMEGLLNGKLTVKRGANQCVVEGLMAEPAPLGDTGNKFEEIQKAEAERLRKFNEDLAAWQKEEDERQRKLKEWEKSQGEGTGTQPPAPEAKPPT